MSYGDLYGEPPWRKPLPGDLSRLMWKPFGTGHPILRGRKVRSAEGLKRPGGWMPCDVPEYMKLDDGVAYRLYFILMSCPYTLCGKVFMANRETKDPHRHSLRCPDCNRHIWFWVEGKHEVEKDNPFETLKRPRKKRGGKVHGRRMAKSKA